MSKSPNNQRVYSNCTIKRLEWHGLYAKSWNSAPLVPEAYAHPAKVSFGLAEQIYKFMLDEGMIKEGDVIGDPFGGIAGFAFHAMLNGLHWRGVELEPRFVDLGSQNIELWNGRYAPHFERWGTAVLLQGDSRNFAELVGGVACVVSSPPYSESHITSYTTGRIGDNEESPWKQTAGDNYNRANNNQLGSMKEGDLSAVISSPPYADTIENGDGPGARWDFATHRNGAKVSSAASYGRSDGQLGRLGAVVTSPPFEKTQDGGGIGAAFRGESDYPLTAGQGGKYQGYFAAHQGESIGQLGNERGDTFWQASRAIVEQVYIALRPGGYAAFVTGDFVRRGQRVRFGEQWLALCEACGFTAVTWAVAWKTERHGAQLDIFGGTTEKRTDRVSFFRRLANEKNPEAAILNEDVIFMCKVAS